MYETPRFEEQKKKNMQKGFLSPAADSARRRNLTFVVCSMILKALGGFLWCCSSLLPSSSCREENVRGERDNEKEEGEEE